MINTRAQDLAIDWCHYPEKRRWYSGKSVAKKDDIFLECWLLGMSKG